MRSALVTGASTGIGRATAMRLDAAGWRVFAGVRREADADLLREAGSERLAPLILDVTDAGQIEAAAEEIAARTGSDGLDGLVNNAGIALPSPLETIPIEDFRRQVEVNLTGQVAVTQAMLPAIRAARGRIVFVSSIGGLIAFPMTGAYHAAKFGIEAVGDVFRRELRALGDLGLDRRAGLDRDRDLGPRRGGGRRDRRRARRSAKPSTARRSSATGRPSKASPAAAFRPTGPPGRSSTPSPPGGPGPAT